MIFILVFLSVVASIGYIFRKKLRELFQGSPVYETSHEDERNGLLADPAISLTFGVIHRTKRFAEVKWSNRLKFTINGEKIEVVNPNPDELLSTYLRETLQLKGTKLGCEEGGCGACSVVIRTSDQRVISANSCLRLLCANDGLSITTVEGIGSTSTSLSEEQKRLVANNGTQCGYCTPGWITAMHALVENSQSTGEPLKPQDIEKHFDGNICRCTGYRPIMQAYHSMCHGDHQGHSCAGMTNRDACRPMTAIEDIEGNCHSYNTSLVKTQARKVTRATKTSWTSSPPLPLYFFNPLNGKKYFRPLNMSQLLAVIGEFPSEMQTGQVKFLAGNTAIGVTKYLNNTAPFYYADESKILVDVNMVPDLAVNDYNASKSQLTVGAAMKISDLIERLLSLSSNIHGTTAMSSDLVNCHSLFSVTAHHLYRIANTQVRNAGSWAGNLMIFLKYKTFPSDAVLALTTASAVLHLADVNNNRFDLTMEQFLQLSYEEFCAAGMFLLSMTLTESSPSNSSSNLVTIAETQKVAIRERNAHAYVNAGFNFQVIQAASGAPPTCSAARIVFGGVSNTIFIAQRAQAALVNQAFTTSTFMNVLNALNLDLSAVGVATSQQCDLNFLISTMQNYLYLAFLRAYRIDTLPKNVASAVLPWVKPISRGVEVFPINPDGSPSTSTAPVGKPVRKLEGPIQATGQATYPSDEQLPPNGCQGAIVFATECAKKLVAIDTSAAAQIPGVVAVLTAADIPGVNDLGNSLEVLVSIGSVVPCVGAPVAIVVATSEQIALQAVQYVRVTYDSSSSATVPITNIDEAIAANSFYSNLPPFLIKIQTGSPTQALQAAPYRSSGRVYAGGQYHFYMETQSAFASVKNGEDLTITCGTQDPAFYASQIATILGMTSNQVS